MCLTVTFRMGLGIYICKLLQPIRFVKTEHWDNKQQSQAQSDQCKISTDGVPISCNHPSIWNLVRQKWYKFRWLWLHSTNVVIVTKFINCHVLAYFITTSSSLEKSSMNTVLKPCVHEIFLMQGVGLGC